jgi:outer membrane protein OmpA-like peptidoglycan-associated protein
MKYILAILLSFAIVGCTTTDPYTGEQKTSKTAKGAGIGAIAGAVLGAATGDDKKDRRDRALKGAVLGGVIGNNLYLVMPGNITFSTGNADIRSDFFDVLNSVAKVLAEFNQTSIKVSGHTDSTGSDSINQPLSERRADSVAMYLRSQKVSSARIQSYGYGSRYPVASNDTAAGREANRRVELELVPNE